MRLGGVECDRVELGDEALVVGLEVGAEVGPQLVRPQRPLELGLVRGGRNGVDLRHLGDRGIEGCDFRVAVGQGGQLGGDVVAGIGPVTSTGGSTGGGGPCRNSIE